MQDQKVVQVNPNFKHEYMRRLQSSDDNKHNSLTILINESPNEQKQKNKFQLYMQ